MPHSCIPAGVVRYADDAEMGPGQSSGYKEYERSECLQMVGRAGRPQYDTEGVAVIMTQRDMVRCLHV